MKPENNIHSTGSVSTTCQNCKKDFIIEIEDFNFYEKIKVSPPTWCSGCRLERRLSFVVTWGVFWRACDRCDKKTFSMYPPEQKVKVFCPDCFWADDWDGTEYGKDYDSSRPFWEQIKELLESVPLLAIDVNYTTLKNSDYSNGIGWSKNCYMTFWADFCEDVFYSSILNKLKRSADCIRGYESELCYGSVGFSRCYNMFFSDQCDDCLDVWFSRDCYGCTNCIGCVNLRGAKNCIFNQQYSKEEYEKKVRELKLDSYESLQKIWEEAYKFWLSKPYREYNGHSLNFNVSGEHVYTSRNSKEMYIANGTENSKWCQFITVPPVKDSWDYSGWGNNAELMYECASVGENASNIKFCVECFPDCMSLEYCFWCIAGKNNFGCASLKRKQYAILNKVYSKEEYQKLKEQIIEDMKKNPYTDKLRRKYFYGEFFAPELSRFYYNYSNAMRFVPKTKEQAQSEGYNWIEREESSHNITFPGSSLPDKITETKDEILEEIIGCINCGKGYKITKGEFDLLRKMNLPVPHECPKCRESKRFARMTVPKLYDRECAKCGVAIRTPYAPDDKKIVYCIKCYQQEFL